MNAKEDLIDVVIVSLLCAWGVYELFLTPFFYDRVVTIFIGVCLSYLLPLCCKRTDVKYQKIRCCSLQYSITYVIAIFCALQIVEVLRDCEYGVTGLKLVFVGVFFQSVYFLIAKRRWQKKKGECK